MLLAGALAEPVDSALFIWKDSTAEACATTALSAPSIQLV